MADKTEEELKELEGAQDQVIELNEAPKIEATKEEEEAFIRLQQRKVMITTIVGVVVNVISMAIVLFPMFAATKKACKDTANSCSATWGLPFVFIPAAVVVVIYASWISTFIYWHETEMTSNGKLTRNVPKKLMRTIIVINGLLDILLLVVAMIVLMNQA